MEIDIKFIDPKKQRYPTAGDYYKKGDKLFFRVSKQKDWRYEMLVLIHEMVEWSLINHRKIKISDIDSWDKKFERGRNIGFYGQNDEPGDDKRSPYNKEHCFATEIEKKLAKELGVKWDEYN